MWRPECSTHSFSSKTFYNHKTPELKVFGFGIMSRARCVSFLFFSLVPFYSWETDRAWRCLIMDLKLINTSSLFKTLCCLKHLSAAWGVCRWTEVSVCCCFQCGFYFTCPLTITKQKERKIMLLLTIIFVIYCSHFFEFCQNKVVLAGGFLW